ncbi:hypothetical protein [Fusobacterium russii]|uniref:hypothetical protein n=1 Tax=Fusobacterium russii TaxID=854 RepID=UPI0003A08B30|nr:hypothetical protein [Fusobacterium russii]
MKNFLNFLFVLLFSILSFNVLAERYIVSSEKATVDSEILKQLENDIKVTR